MAEMKTPVVHIRYKSEYGTSPEETQILATDPLTPVQLPVLSAKGDKFVGWVHVNPDGHESSLSERMILSTDWLIPTGQVNNFYVIFTARWVNARPKGTVDAEVYTGEYVVVPNSTEQTLPTADKLMQQDVVVTAIPYEEIDNFAVVRYTPQTLTEEQKAQARTNIGVSAGGGLTLSAIYLLIDILQHANYTEDMSSQIERLADALMGGGNTDGGFNITDDGNGNVTITTWGSATITDDGSGNVTIIAPGDASITDDGSGNVVIA